MITLHGFGANFGLADPSPFVLKVDVYLRMAEIEYEFNSSSKNLGNAPKGKLPFIQDDDRIIADSQAIIQYLENKNSQCLDEKLSAQQKAQAYLITKSLDENLYFCLVYSRWLMQDTWPIVKKAFFGFLPPVIRDIVPAMVRKKIKRNLDGQGLARHSEQEILAICRLSFQALSDLIEGKPYLFGERPSTLDASCFAHLAGFILVDIDNPFNRLAKEFPVLVNYCKSIKENYYCA